MISFLNGRLLRSRVLGGRICPFLFESTADRFPIVTHALTQNATWRHGFGSLDRRATIGANLPAGDDPLPMKAGCNVLGRDQKLQGLVWVTAEDILNSFGDLFQYKDELGLHDLINDKVGQDWRNIRGWWTLARSLRECVT